MNADTGCGISISIFGINPDSIADNGLRALIFSCLERGNAHPTLTGPQGISPEMVTGVRTRVQTRIRNPINRSVTATDLVDDAIRQYQAARPENDGNFVD